MAKFDLVANAGDYAPVADRITLFYARYPAGRIITELVARTEQEITFRALVYRSPDEAEPAATGWAAERIGDGDVNTVACLENTETSAIGRALANLGLTASTNRPSAEEMAKAERARSALGTRRRDSPRHAGGAFVAALVRERPTRPVNEALQARADRITSALSLLGAAERAGVPAADCRRLREVLADRSTAPATIERIERHLREWLGDLADAHIASRAVNQRHEAETRHTPGTSQVEGSSGESSTFTSPGCATSASNGQTAN